MSLHLQSGSKNKLAFAMAFCLAVCVPAHAHHGPPIPIIKNQQVGPYSVSLWGHPNLGTGMFFVMVDPAPGGTVPGDLKVRIAVQPESGRLPEAVYEAWRDDSVRDQVQFDNDQVAFDKQEFWRLRVIVESSVGGGDALARVEATPTGFGKWDLLLYALPFLFVIFLFGRGISRRRRAQSGVPAQAGLTG